jgi:hypothetical protein
MHTTIRFSVNVTDAAGNHRVRVYRDGDLIHDGKFSSLKFALEFVSQASMLMAEHEPFARSDVSP